jgi:membrane protein implicated in regulation of membrane protease activity
MASDSSAIVILVLGFILGAAEVMAHGGKIGGFAAAALNAGSWSRWMMTGAHLGRVIAKRSWR